MATMHPTNVPVALNLGAYRERDILELLAQGLSAGFDVFHNVHWSSLHQGQQSFGEVDVVVVSPIGHLLLLEIKAGKVTVTDQGITKQYGAKQFGGHVPQKKTSFTRSGASTALC